MNPDWKTYSIAAKRYWCEFEPEKAVRSCLSYLHSQIQPPAYKHCATSSRQPNIILGAGGSGERWLNFTGKPKHLIDTGDRLPLIQRTINLLSHCFEGSDIYVVIGKENKELYSQITGCTLLIRSGEPSSSLYLEILDDQLKTIPT